MRQVENKQGVDLSPTMGLFEIKQTKQQQQKAEILFKFISLRWYFATYIRSVISSQSFATHIFTIFYSMSTFVSVFLQATSPPLIITIWVKMLP